MYIFSGNTLGECRLNIFEIERRNRATTVVVVALFLLSISKQYIYDLW